jgi:molecular chaperone HscB
LRRTEYLLKLHGAQIGASARSGATVVRDQGKTSGAPADLLEEVFDLNMQLEEMRRSRKIGEEDPVLKETLLEAKRKFEALVDAVDRDLRAQWAVWDTGDAAARQSAQQAMVALLDRRRYLSNLVRDVTEILGD